MDSFQVQISVKLSSDPESDDDVQLIASPPKRKRADDGSDDEVQILPSPPKRGSTGGTFSCVICMDDVERSQRLKLRNCGHIFCGECVAGTLKAALDDRKVDDRLRCPDTSCRTPLDVLDVRACTYDRGDKATWTKYQEVATEALLDQANADEGNEKGLRRCPGDKCNHTFYYEPHATSGTLHICQKCHGAFCLGCPLVGGKVGPAHDGNCAYVMQQEAARKAHQEKYDKWCRPASRTPARRWRGAHGSTAGRSRTRKPTRSSTNSCARSVKKALQNRARSASRRSRRTTGAIT